MLELLSSELDELKTMTTEDVDEDTKLTGGRGQISGGLRSVSTSIISSPVTFSGPRSVAFFTDAKSCQSLPNIAHFQLCFSLSVLPQSWWFPRCAR